MKKYSIIAAFIFSSIFVYAYQRKTQPRRMILPLYAESSKIDSLFEYIVKDNKHSIYLSFMTMKTEGGYIFSITPLESKSTVVHHPFMVSKYNKNFGYFMFKGLTIFVIGDRDPFQFFKKTKKSKSFNFKDTKNDDDIPENSFLYTYRFTAGRFIPEPLLELQ